jgi:exopolysaccharide production protein ExoQ
MSSVALVACIGAIAVLLYLDRDPNVRSSKALWLPVLWLAIIGSRPASVWLAGGQSSGGPTLDSALEGNSTDALILSTLMAVGAAVLIARRKDAGKHLRANVLVLIYFTYCLMSVFWSPFPDVAFKRWTKAVGDLVMVVLIMSDGPPLAAIPKVFSRVGIFLLPASLYLVRYSNLGRGYDPDGNPANWGVTTNKNTLGVLAFVVGLSAFWSVCQLLHAKGQLNRGQRLLAQTGLLGLAGATLRIAHSATSTACFVLGAVLIVTTGFRLIGSRPRAVHALFIVTAVTAACTILLGGQAIFVEAVGRDATLTGRTEIWSTVIPLSMNPMFGAGFESFWNAISPTLRQLPEKYKFGNLNSAHNGYIDVYLNIGFVGLTLVVWILLTAYIRACATFRRERAVGGLFLAYAMTTAIYSITEAGFRTMSLTWICLLIAIIGASGVVYAPAATPESPVRGPGTPESPVRPWSATAGRRTPRRVGSFAPVRGRS